MVPLVFKLLLGSLAVLPSVTAKFTFNGFSVTFDNNVSYFVSPYTAGNISAGLDTLSSAESVHGFYPVTAIQHQIATKNISAVLANFSKTDDVYSEAFSQTILLGDAQNDQDTDYNCIPLEDRKIPSGPYFLEASTGSLYQPYRLYSDWAGSFINSLLQAPDGSFQPLSAQVSGASALTIGVPSRLYYTKTAEKPLAGVRIGVKDIFDVEGVKTGGGSRAYYNLYPPAEATALAIQRLIDAGAIIVGKQKTSQFAVGESATSDWVDYHSPWNPRGDGYQQTQSSSAGAGSSMASYNWLDMAIGSDTAGSIRAPSGAQGVFGNRPSYGLVDLSTGVIPLAPGIDTVGFLLRDPVLWDVAQSVMYADKYKRSSTSSYPKKIQVLAGYPTNTSEGSSSKLFAGFLDSLAAVTGATVEEINMADAWADGHPAGTSDNIIDLMSVAFGILMTKDQTTLLRDTFYADYAAAHDGRAPFVNPSPLAWWSWSDEQDDALFKEALANKTILTEWFNSEIMPAAEDDTCSESLMVYAGNAGGEGYLDPRDSFSGPPNLEFGWTDAGISVFSGVPDFVLPLGESPFFSNASNHVETMPVAVDIMAAKGCDGMLTRLALDLVEAGIVPIPKTGRTLQGGDVLI